MAVFCDRTGVRIVAPTGDEKADAVAYREKTGNVRPLSVEADPANGWQLHVTPQPAPAPEPKTTAAPPVERATKPAERSAHETPRKGSR